MNFTLGSKDGRVGLVTCSIILGENFKVYISNLLCSQSVLRALTWCLEASEGEEKAGDGVVLEVDGLAIQSVYKKSFGRRALKRLNH